MENIKEIVIQSLVCNDEYVVPWDNNTQLKYTKNKQIENLITTYCNNTDIEMHRNNNGAFYYPYIDKIVIPPRCWFNNINEYYRIVFHEICHSTGSEYRYDRKYFDYTPFEELVAEIGAIKLMEYFNIDNEFSYNNSLAYCNGWIWEIISDSQIDELKCLVNDLINDIENCQEFILIKGGCI